MRCSLVTVFFVSFLFFRSSFSSLNPSGYSLHLITSNNTTHALGRTPLDEGSAHHNTSYLTTVTRKKTSTSAAGFETANPASERPYSRALSIPKTNQASRITEQNMKNEVRKERKAYLQMVDVKILHTKLYNIYQQNAIFLN